ncbi:hypothetical protein BR93DRAFT_9086 [Coniochaeta sp. PMI_546]|nr:hypothetical protein BR93DRAFT_9086 [Coniochaeta sp. PMI_546]
MGIHTKHTHTHAHLPAVEIRPTKAGKYLSSCLHGCILFLRLFASETMEMAEILR